jgi:hypothetical protein
LRSWEENGVSKGRGLGAARLGRIRGIEADFSAALLTESVSSFGRNDDLGVWRGGKGQPQRLRGWSVIFHPTLREDREGWGTRLVRKILGAVALVDFRVLFREGMEND